MLQSEMENPLYWIGCVTTYRLPNIARETVQAFRKMGVKPKFLGEKEGCCGIPLLCASLLNEAEKNANKIAKTIEKETNLLVTGCAGCYRAFIESYPQLKVDANFKVLHVSQYLEELVKLRNNGFQKVELKVTYHDPCELGRYCQVYDSPRNVLKLIPGLELVETERSRENCSCCGAGGGVFGVFTRMSLGIAYRKFLNEIVPLKVEALITACPTCYMNFSYVIKRKKLPIKLYDLTEIVNIALL